MPDSPLLVLTNSPDADSAQQLANQIIDQSLAACVNILPPMQSIYSWKGVRQRATENQLLIKTTQKRYADLESFIMDNHPYELPEIIAMPLEAGLPAYLNWINSCCEEPDEINH